MKKYTKKWKEHNQKWLQIHKENNSQRVYQHYIQYGTEYSRLTGYTSLRDAVSGGMTLTG